MLFETGYEELSRLTRNVPFIFPRIVSTILP
jgi:hypothetical protein